MLDIDKATIEEANGRFYQCSTGGGAVYYLFRTSNQIYWLNTPDQCSAIVAEHDDGMWPLKMTHYNNEPTLFAAQVLLNR